jgi:3-(3-hydroxy-phenyl)propionate hydroxylase
VPATLAGSPLNTPDTDRFAGALRPGAPAADAPVRVDGHPSWVLRETASGAFTALLFAGTDATGLDAAARGLAAAARELAPLAVLVVAPSGGAPAPDATPRTLVDTEGLLAARYDATPGTVYLLRPDQHVCARWRQAPDEPGFAAALRRALAQESSTP